MNEPKYLFFNSYKGGVGRTFSLINLAFMFKNYSTKKILIVDMDFKAPGVFPHFGLGLPDSNKTLSELIKSPNDIAIKDCVTNIKGHKYESNKHENFFIIPSSRIDKDYFAEIFDEAREAELPKVDKRLNTLKETIKKFAIEENFDIIFFDFPAGFNVQNMVNNVLAKPDIIFMVTNLNLQGIEGVTAYLDILDQKKSDFVKKETNSDVKTEKDSSEQKQEVINGNINKENKLRIYPILNKLMYTHPRFGSLSEKMEEALLGKTYDYLEYDGFFNVNFFDEGVVGEFNLEDTLRLDKKKRENLFEQYRLDSALDYDKTAVYKRSAENDGTFNFYQNMYMMYKEVCEILYQEDSRYDFANKEDNKVDKKIRILVEETHYSKQIEEKVNKQIKVNPNQLNDDDNIPADVWPMPSSQILNMFDSEKEMLVDDTKEPEKYDIISLPYFCLQKAIKNKQIISLEELVGEDAKKKAEINSIRKYFKENIINVDSKGMTYGIPFSNISSCIAFDIDYVKVKGENDNIKVQQLNYNDILFDPNFIWGMVDNVDAYSHYYEFVNVLGSYNIDFFTQTHPSIYGKNNLDDDRLKKALKTYLKLYLKSEKFPSWNEIGKGLDNGERGIKGCFLWTEQLKGLTNNSLDFCGIPVIYGEKHNQGEGWFICPTKNAKGKPDDVLKIFRRLASKPFQEFLFNNLGSSPSPENDERCLHNKVLEQKRESSNGNEWEVLKKSTITTQRILTNISPKANFEEIARIMKKFSEIIHKNAKSEEYAFKDDTSVDTLTEDVLGILEREVKKILDNKYF